MKHTIETIEKENTISKGTVQILDGYSFYKFIEALSNIRDEIPLRFDPINKVLNISVMDSHRICMMNINIKEDTNIEVTDLKRFLKVKKNINVKVDGSVTGEQVCISLDDFRDILKIKKETQKNVKLIFGDPYKLEIEKRKDNDYGLIKKSLVYLDLEFEEILLSSLESVEYLNKITISKKLLSDMFYESNKYSGICEIKTDEKGISFGEEGVIGGYEAIYPYDILESCDCDGSEDGMYAYHLLDVIKNFLDIMEKGDTIRIYQKTDYPLKVIIRFKRINTTITYYVARRVLEEESDDDKEELDDNGKEVF